MGRWVVVTDSRRARIFEVAPDRSALKEVDDLVNTASHEPVADSRGHGFDGRGGTRHGMESKTLPKEHDMALFAHELSRFLQREFAANHFKELVLVAAPDWLGQLREALHDSVLAVLKPSIPKNLTLSPVSELLDHLKSAKSL